MNKEKIQGLIKRYKKDTIEQNKAIHKLFEKDEFIEEMLLVGKKTMLIDVIKDLEDLIKNDNNKNR